MPVDFPTFHSQIQEIAKFTDKQARNALQKIIKANVTDVIVETAEERKLLEEDKSLLTKLSMRLLKTEKQLLDQSKTYISLIKAIEKIKKTTASATLPTIINHQQAALEIGKVIMSSTRLPNDKSLEKIITEANKNKELIKTKKVKELENLLTPLQTHGHALMLTNGTYSIAIIYNPAINCENPYIIYNVINNSCLFLKTAIEVADKVPAALNQDVDDEIHYAVITR